MDADPSTRDAAHEGGDIFAVTDQKGMLSGHKRHFSSETDVVLKQYWSKDDIVPGQEKEKNQDRLQLNLSNAFVLGVE